MTSIDFTNWLKGYLAATKGALSAERIAEVQAKMAEICEFAPPPYIVINPPVVPYVSPWPTYPELPSWPTPYIR